MICKSRWWCGRSITDPAEMDSAAVRVYYGNLLMLPDLARVLACMHEKDVKFELFDMNKGRHPFPAEFSKIQAYTRVPGPAFDDGTRVLFESRAICRHISEKYSEKGNRFLLGRDLLERCSIEQWVKSEEHSFDPPSWTLIFNLAFAPSLNLEPDSGDIHESERKLSEVLDVYEQRLGESKYLASNEFSLADLTHLPSSHFLANSKELSYLFTSRKHVYKWWKKVSERASWKQAAMVLDKAMEDLRGCSVNEDEGEETVTVSFHKEQSPATGTTVIQSVGDEGSVALATKIDSQVGLIEATPIESTLDNKPDSSQQEATAMKAKDTEESIPLSLEESKPTKISDQQLSGSSPPVDVEQSPSPPPTEDSPPPPPRSDDTMESIPLLELPAPSMENESTSVSASSSPLYGTALDQKADDSQPSHSDEMNQQPPPTSTKVELNMPSSNLDTSLVKDEPMPSSPSIPPPEMESNLPSSPSIPPPETESDPPPKGNVNQQSQQNLPNKEPPSSVDV